MVRVAKPAPAWLVGAANRRIGVALRTASHRAAPDVAAAEPGEAGLLPGLVRQYGERALHERDACAVLDLRHPLGEADVRPVGSPPTHQGARPREARLASRHRRSPPARARA